MTTLEKKVLNICDEVYKNNFQQITIDLIQDGIEPLVGKMEDVTGKVVGASSGEVGAAAYETDILLEVFNPKFCNDIDLLTRLKNALDEWSDDIEATNIILGLPKES